VNDKQLQEFRVANQTEGYVALNQQRRESWSRYWSIGALHSCAGSFAGNYSGEVHDFWRRAINGLGNDIRLLDIATGNGALPRLMFDLLAPQIEFTIEAIDLADVRPAWVETIPDAWRQRLHFHAGVAAENLPFDDASMDLVMSQFGLEYTVLQHSLAEIRRVSRQGGRLALVVHASDSLIVGQAREELSHIDWLQQANGLPALANAMCDPVARSATPDGRATLTHDAGANSLRREFNQAMADATARAKLSRCADVLLETQSAIAEALSACGSRGQAGDGHERLAKMLVALADNEFRLRELVSCAIDQKDAQSLAARAGAVLESISAIHFQNGETLGWGLLARFER